MIAFLYLAYYDTAAMGQGAAQRAVSSAPYLYAYCRTVSDGATRSVKITDLITIKLPNKTLQAQQDAHVQLDKQYLGGKEPSPLSGCSTFPDREDAERSRQAARNDLIRFAGAVERDPFGVAASPVTAGTSAAPVSEPAGANLNDATVSNAVRNRAMQPLPNYCLDLREAGWGKNRCSQKANVTYCNLAGTMLCSQQSFGTFTMGPRGKTGTAAKGGVVYIICPYPATAQKVQFVSGRLIHGGCR